MDGKDNLEAPNEPPEQEELNNPDVVMEEDEEEVNDGVSDNEDAKGGEAAEESISSLDDSSEPPPGSSSFLGRNVASGSTTTTESCDSGIPKEGLFLDSDDTTQMGLSLGPGPSSYKGGPKSSFFDPANLNLSDSENDATSETSKEVAKFMKQEDYQIPVISLPNNGRAGTPYVHTNIVHNPIARKATGTTKRPWDNSGKGGILTTNLKKSKISVFPEITPHGGAGIAQKEEPPSKSAFRQVKQPDLKLVTLECKTENNSPEEKGDNSPEEKGGLEIETNSTVGKSDHRRQTISSQPTKEANPSAPVETQKGESQSNSPIPSKRESRSDESDEN